MIRALSRTGLRPWHMQGLAFGGIALCIGLWIRAKTVGQEERGNAERRALFVGLWPPTFWLIGESLAKRRAAEGDGRGHLGQRGLARVRRLAR